MLKLRFTNNKHNAVWLVEPKVSLGASAECDLVLKGEDVHPRHAEILVDHENLTFKLLKASSQTRINNQLAKVNQAISLKPADTILIAGVELEVIDPKLEARPKPPEPTAAKASTPSAPAEEDTGWSLKANHAALANKVFKVARETTVGRSNECDITLAAAHLSRRHAELSVKDGLLFVKDLGSANGTFVNGKRISESRVKRGDDLRFDTLSFGVMGPSDDLDKTSVRSVPVGGANPAKASAGAQAGPRPQNAARSASQAASGPQSVETITPSRSGSGSGLWIGVGLLVIIAGGIFVAIQNGWF